MKAAQISEYGNSSVVKINEISVPSPAENQVKIEVYAASLNPFDVKLRAGIMQQAIPLTLPTTLGGDIAGVITELGTHVSNLAVGDKIYGQAAVVAGNGGAFAEYTVTTADQVAIAPHNLSFNEAASLPLVGVSALQALTQHINLQHGQRLLIQGGSGGIGSIAIQIAKHIGAYVATTAPGNAADFVKSLGADEVIDYKTQDFTTLIHDYDAVYDMVGGETFEKSLRILKPGGIAVSMVGHVEDAVANTYDVTAISQQTRVNPEILNQLTQLIEAGVVTPRVAKVFPLEQIQQAFEAYEAGGVTGKIVIEIKKQQPTD
jgi:NADPH:quinone reductase-like Zn-dependent oxidoreductase